MCCAIAHAQMGRDDVVVVDDARLQDGMQQHWPPEVVARHVALAVRRFRPARVLTFDAGGVSAHPNHCATCEGVLWWWSALPRSCSSLSSGDQDSSSSGGGSGGRGSDDSARCQPELWQLRTVGLARKYLPLAALDAIAALLLAAALPWLRLLPEQQCMHRHLCCLRPWRAWRALLAHGSQMVW